MELSKKLQLTPGAGIRVLNAPSDLELELPAGSSADGILVFVENQAELESLGAPALDAAREDRLSWIAYPKAGQLDTDLNRDILWRLLAGRGVRPVRQIAIDDVWSALRFRPDR